MKTFFVLIIVMVILLAGCFDSGQETPETKEMNESEETEEIEETTETPEGIIEAPSGPGNEEDLETDNSGRVARTQEDCATMTPDCESCLDVEGCGWCKCSSSCLIGTADGPSTSLCDENEWTYEKPDCADPVNDGSCEEQTNCASCLTGSRCKWCIQGSVCSSESSTDDCFGGWLTESFQCNFASR